MRSRLTFIMVVMVIASAGLLLILFRFGSRDAEALNGFVRRFASVKALPAIDTIDVAYDSYYISGQTEHHVYLGNIVAPRHLLVLNIHTSDTQHVELKLDHYDKLEYWSMMLEVDSPYFYLADGTVPIFFKGTLGSRHAGAIPERGPYFLKMQPIGPSSFVVRSLDSRNQGKLGKVSFGPVDVDFPSDLLTKQVDGIFCTDGMMHFDPITHRVVYLYFYRNEYLVMDSSLNLLFKGQTIDTTTVARIDVATVRSENSITMSSPPLVVNKRSAIRENILLVNSNLRADNEDHSTFSEFSVIDLYRLNERHAVYLLSIYVPSLDRNKLKDFCISENRLIALYEDQIVLYDFGLKDIRRLNISE